MQSVKDAGGSESFAVMVEIGVQALPYAERQLTSCGCDRMRRRGKPSNRGSVYKGSPVATSVLGPGLVRYGPCDGLLSRWFRSGAEVKRLASGAPWDGFQAVLQNNRMAQQYPLNCRVLQGALVMLERSAGRLARCVLRGLGGCEPTWPPGGSDRIYSHP